MKTAVLAWIGYLLNPSVQVLITTVKICKLNWAFMLGLGQSSLANTSQSKSAQASTGCEVRYTGQSCGVLGFQVAERRSIRARAGGMVSKAPSDRDDQRCKHDRADEVDKLPLHHLPIVGNCPLFLLN